MKLTEKQIEKTFLPEIAGFNAEKIDAAVRDYFKHYEENSTLPRFFNFAVNDVVSISVPVASQNSVTKEMPRGVIPISSGKSPFKNGVTLGLSVAVNDTNIVESPSKTVQCRDLNPKEVAQVLELIDLINKQLIAEEMPHLFFKPEFLVPGYSVQNEPTIHVRSCTGLLDDGIAGDYSDWSKRVKARGASDVPVLRATIRIDEDVSVQPFPAVLAHEISHMFANHPQDVVDLSKVDREVLTYLCSHSDRAGTRGSSLIYNTACYSQTGSYSKVPVKKLGPSEMLTLKRFYSLNETQRLQDVDRSIGEIVKDIRVQYGSRLASATIAQATGGFFAALVFTTMAHALGNSKQLNTKNLLVAASAFSQMVGLAVMVSQLPNQAIISLGAATALAGASQISQTSKAFSKLLSSAGLSMTFLSLLRGQPGFALGLAAAYGGPAAGRLCAEIINTLCSRSRERPAGYLQAHTSSLSVENPVTENPSSFRTLCSRVQSTAARAVPEPLRKVIEKIGEVDQRLAQVIDEYPTFNIVYKKLLKEHQQAVIETSVHSTGMDATTHAADEYFVDVLETPDEVGVEQIVEIEIRQITAQDQLEAVEDANHLFIDLERAQASEAR